MTETLDEARPNTSIWAGGRPAAGGGFTYQQPGSERQLIALVAFRLVTSAAVANRLVTVAFKGGDGVVIGTFGAGFTQAASLTTDYTFGVGLNAYGANGAAAIGAPLPLLWFQDPISVVASVAAVDAGDQISNVRVTVIQVPSPVPGDPQA